MGTYLVLVMSDPVDGRDDEYNQWYEHTHLDEVLVTAGFTSAQRFALEGSIGPPAGPPPPRPVRDRRRQRRGSGGPAGRPAGRTPPERRPSIGRGAALWVFSPTGERHVVPH